MSDVHLPAPERPHHKIWPKRLPRELVIPDTTLYFNLEVAAKRFPDKAAYRFFGRAQLNYTMPRTEHYMVVGLMGARS